MLQLLYDEVDVARLFRLALVALTCELVLLCVGSAWRDHNLEYLALLLYLSCHESIPVDCYSPSFTAVEIF